MNHSPRQYYILDVHHQPPGYRDPVVREQHRILARSDTEAIGAAEAIFAALDPPSVTGFVVRAIGSRRFCEQAICRRDKAVATVPAKHAAD